MTINLSEDIPFLGNKYAITNDGMVWSHPNRRHNGMWLKPQDDKGELI